MLSFQNLNSFVQRRVMATTIKALCVVLKASGSLGGNTEKQQLVSLPELKYWSANVSEMITR